ncbi:PQQ-binding-like beta-propeller repeat protein [Duganella sp. BuS-21]|uniref:outer membrane protein assembly factor BamB family protein n=1 Tax=Duganella sp. BuS-21 TaxID=2943848 RepID=UPI0035A5ABF8
MRLSTSLSLPYLAVAAGSLVLAACGGGGSNTPGVQTPTPTTPTPPPVVPPPVVAAPYTISPATLTMKYVAGYPVTFFAKATQTTPFVGVVYIKMVADQNVIDSVEIKTNADGSINASLNTSGTVAAGHYAGNLTINVCKDVNCTAQLEGAPFKVPYVIDVASPAGSLTTANLSSLVPLAGAGDWSGYQANAAHTGLVPVTLNPSTFKLRWTYETPAANGSLGSISDISTGNGHVYFGTGTYWNNNTAGHQLLALKEQDGSQAWNHDFGNLRYASTNPPTYANGKVYLSAGSQESTAMFGFDAASGAQLFSTPTAAQWPTYLAPVVYGGGLYSNGGRYGGMYAFDAITGVEKWFASLTQVDGWAPAVDANNTYIYLNGEFIVTDRLTGNPVGKIAGSNSGWQNGVTPLLGAVNSAIVADSNALSAFDISALRVRWKVDGSFHTGPAYGDKQVYVLRDQPLALEVRNETDGSLAWSWKAPATVDQWLGNVVLTNNLVFVSSDNTTYAIDRSSHASVWTYPAGGKLSLSANGVLYINTQSSIVAINVK